MSGEIKIGRWWPFTATQIIIAGTGFSWLPIIGNRLIRFVGGDVLGPDGANMEFRIHDLIPVVRGGGEDVAKSARGRLAAETVAWLPQALVPETGARWSPVDRSRATVTLDAAGADIDVTITVDDEGRLTDLVLQRWQGSAKPPAFLPFGGSFDDEVVTEDGVRIAGTGTVGWQWQTGDEEPFLRYRIDSARPLLRGR